MLSFRSFFCSSLCLLAFPAFSQSQVTQDEVQCKREMDVYIAALGVVDQSTGSSYSTASTNKSISAAEMRELAVRYGYCAANQFARKRMFSTDKQGTAQAQE